VSRRTLLIVLALVFAGTGVVSWQACYGAAPPTLLSFRIGQSFEEVVRNSTYGVRERSNIPTSNYLQAGQTFVTEPAVILQFSDHKHGFTLPPTKFAMVTYMDNKVETVATSPMLEKLPFNQAVAILENLQNQFKAGEWKPWTGDGSKWFDLTDEGKKQLYARMFQPGFSQEATLRVPNKFGMTVRFWCAEGCRTGMPPYLFMIDIGVGRDTEGSVSTSSG
jgi:hypothetical protein